jgi:hypothetical protein
VDSPLCCCIGLANRALGLPQQRIFLTSTPLMQRQGDDAMVEAATRANHVLEV